MNSTYVKALETKADWLEYSKYKTTSTDRTIDGVVSQVENLAQATLLSPNTFVMNNRFAELVDHARMSIPDDIEWDNSWMQTPTGFLWIEGQFSIPDFKLDDSTRKRAKQLADEIGMDLDNPRMMNIMADHSLVQIRIPSIGWVPISSRRILPGGNTFGHMGDPDKITDATAFICYFANQTNDGYEPWSYFTLATGDKLIDKIKAFERLAMKEGGAYESDRITEMTHEIRWIYAAFHLMSQRLAIQIEHETDRATRRRAERDKKIVPRKFRVISLRRYEEAKEKHQRSGGIGEPTEYKWQWTVRGHWRQQWYPSEQIHKQIFIESFIKGPEDAPFKPIGDRIFKAVR